MQTSQKTDNLAVQLPGGSVMDANSSSSRARRGFTLIELLAVVVIIGILAALITAAAFSAKKAAVQATYSMEMGRLSEALYAFKNEFGEFPPDNAADAASFMRRKFPQGQAADVAGIDGASALVFWLGGMGGGGDPFYTFSPERLGAGGVYFAAEGKNGKFAPYVYFKAAPGGGYEGKTWAGAAEWGTTTPHFNTAIGEWVQPDSFQIHCPGIDGKHGPGKDYPAGSDYGDDDYDDQTDFSGGPLSGKMP
jgi:prepilin-type N-terminal cleavage/methylation domain-containing protein